MEHANLVPVSKIRYDRLGSSPPPFVSSTGSTPSYGSSVGETLPPRKCCAATLCCCIFCEFDKEMEVILRSIRLLFLRLLCHRDRRLGEPMLRFGARKRLN